MVLLLLRSSFCNIYLGLLGGARFLYDEALCIGILPIGHSIFHDAEERNTRVFVFTYIGI